MNTWTRSYSETGSVIESCQTEHAENLYIIEYDGGAIICEAAPNRCVSLKRPKQ